MRIRSDLIFVASLLLLITSCDLPSHKKISSTHLHSAVPFSESDNTQCKPIQSLDFSQLTSINNLPDPFTFTSGKSVSTKKDWLCRQQEISTQAQTFSLGIKPAKPETVSSELKSDELIIHVEHQGKTIEFTAKITWPKTGKAPYPAIIGIGGSWINNEELLNQGIALITLPNNEIAEQLNSSSRGKGKFYDLYGADHSAGALIAWAWGVSRLIDGLENQNQINIHRLGVTGCSRNGKGALVAGAFDQRIRLTIPQESGAGGLTSWRISNMQLARGQNVQTLRQIVQENVWFRSDFKQFSESATKLPFDQHQIAGLISPRAMIMVDNTSMEWLGPESTYISAIAAREIWKAQNAENNFGYSQQGAHNHCQLPAEQAVEINAFVQKFLLDNSDIKTNVFRSDGGYSAGDVSGWVDWNVPELRQ